MMRMSLLGLGLVTWFACGDSKPSATDTPDAPASDAPVDGAPLGDILDELRAIPGLTVVEESTTLEGYRFFVMDYQQPVDHDAASGPTFHQRLTLLHRDYAAPT